MEAQKIVGRNPVFEYLKTIKDAKGVRLLVAENAHGKIIDEIKNRASSAGVKVEMCPKEKIYEYHGDSNHQGVILLVPNVSKTLSEDYILELAKERRSIVVLLDQMTDPQNVGSIIRTAEALGAVGVVLPKANSPEITPTIIKASAGATAHIPVLYIANVARFLERAKELELWTVATSDHGNISLTKLSDIKPAVVVIGNEGMGIRKLTEEKCDYTVRIDLKGKISSLNASVAAGIVIYEILKN